MLSPSQLDSPDLFQGPTTRASRNTNEINLGISGRDKTDNTMMQVSFNRYVSQILSATEREAHEKRLEKLAEEAKNLSKTEWMFTPIEKLLGN